MKVKNEKILGSVGCAVDWCDNLHVVGAVFCVAHNRRPRTTMAEWRRQCADGLAVASMRFRANGNEAKADLVLEGAHTIMDSADLGAFRD